jgi:hypothetical protein
LSADRKKASWPEGYIDDYQELVSAYRLGWTTGQVIDATGGAWL